MQTRSDKEIEVELFNGLFKEAQVAIQAEFLGANPIEMTAVRKELRKVGAVARVTKNTLASLAAEKAYKDANPEELKKLLESFVGPILYVFSTVDPVSPARVLSDFSKKIDKLKLRSGFFEGKFINESGLKELATMPSKEESQAKLLATMLAPATQLVRTMQEPAALLVRLLEARRKQLEAQGGGATQA